MTTNTIEDKLKSLILSKMSGDECEITDSVTKEVFFIKSYDGGNTYSLYRGCDLEIGDVPLNSVVRSLRRLHNDLTKNIKRNVYISKWGGCTDLFMLDSLSLVQQGSRYICSDDLFDIYETDKGIVYGG